MIENVLIERRLRWFGHVDGPAHITTSSCIGRFRDSGEHWIGQGHRSTVMKGLQRLELTWEEAKAAINLDIQDWSP